MLVGSWNSDGLLGCHGVYYCWVQLKSKQETHFIFLVIFPEISTHLLMVAQVEMLTMLKFHGKT